MKNGQGIWEGNEKKRRTPCIQINLSEYKNTSSSDMTEECYSLQIVFSYLSGTNPIYCDPILDSLSLYH